MNVEQDIRSLVEAERELRLNAERMARAYREVMTEAAFRLAGQKLEELRRASPDAPDGWTPADWRDFWLTVHLNGGSRWTKENGSGAKLTALEQENLSLRERLERAQIELAQAQKELAAHRMQAAQVQQAQTETKPTNPAKREAERILIPEELPATHRRFVEELKALEIPRPPLYYEHHLRAQENPLRYRRKVLILYVLARGGYSTRMEIDRVISVTEHLSERTGSVRTPAEELVTAGLLVSGTIRMSSPFETGLALYRLSEDGKALCRLWGWEPVESEWERLDRLHQGEVQQAHSVALLAFALHARLRGWSAAILPQVEGTNAAPDALVEKDGERWYVEVERGSGSRRKWQNLAGLNGGKAALCAADEEGRARLVRDCKALRLGGAATDLKTLIFINGELRKMVDITPADELWLERW